MRPWSVVTLPAIAQLPRRRSARRHRQGPQAARDPGWACAVEAKRRALHGAEHRSSIDRVMAGASAVVQIVVIFRARTRTCCSPRSWSRSAAAFGPASHPVRVAVHGQIFPDERDQIVRTIWFLSPRTCQPSSASLPAPASDTRTIDTGTDTHGVSDPPDRRGAIASARARVAHAMFPALIATSALSSGRQRAPPAPRGVGLLG